MPAIKPGPRWAAAILSVLLAAGGVAACSDPVPAPPRIGAAAAASPTPSTSTSPSPSPTLSPSPIAVVAVTPKPAGTHAGSVVPGAYCATAEHGWYGFSSAGAKYRCSLYDNGQWRWKRVGAVSTPTRAPTKAPTPKPTATTHTHSGNVTPGAFCPASEHGWYGYSSSGNKYRCSLYPDEGRWRWKRV